MGREALVLGLAVTCAAAIMAWIIWSERPMPDAAPVSQEVTASSEGEPIPILDEARVAELTSQVEADPNDDTAVGEIELEPPPPIESATDEIDLEIGSVDTLEELTDAEPTDDDTISDGESLFDSRAVDLTSGETEA